MKSFTHGASPDAARIRCRLRPSGLTVGLCPRQSCRPADLPGCSPGISLREHLDHGRAVGLVFDQLWQWRLVPFPTSARTALRCRAVHARTNLVAEHGATPAAPIPGRRHSPRWNRSLNEQSQDWICSSTGRRFNCRDRMRRTVRQANDNRRKIRASRLDSIGTSAV